MCEYMLYNRYYLYSNIQIIYTTKCVIKTQKIYLYTHNKIIEIHLFLPRKKGSCLKTVRENMFMLLSLLSKRKVTVKFSILRFCC